MTEEQREWRDDQEQVGDSANQDRRGAEKFLKKGAEAANQIMEKLQIHAGATGGVVGTMLGCLTLKAFTKAWPRLETPVMAAGYLIGSYAAYRLVKAAFDQEAAEHNPESDAAARCCDV
jgi:hypothetical protein